MVFNNCRQNRTTSITSADQLFVIVKTPFVLEKTTTINS